LANRPEVRSGVFGQRQKETVGRPAEDQAARRWRMHRRPTRCRGTSRLACSRELPAHLARMALFKVNTGCRDQEVCGLKREWEVAVPELETSVFIIPGNRVKNVDERLVILNRVAKAVVKSVRGQAMKRQAPAAVAASA